MANLTQLTASGLSSVFSAVHCRRARLQSDGFGVFFSFVFLGGVVGGLGVVLLWGCGDFLVG